VKRTALLPARVMHCSVLLTIIRKSLPFWRTKPTERWRRTILSPWSTRPFFSWRDPSEQVSQEFKLQGFRPLRLYRLLKIHNFKNSAGSTHWAFSKHSRSLKAAVQGLDYYGPPLIYLFIHSLGCLGTGPHDLMINFSVVPFFTRVLIREAMSLWSQHFEDMLRLL
jgi:hypothetical protein